MTKSLREAAQLALDEANRASQSIPAYGDGGLFFEHHDFNGEYINTEYVDPLIVIQYLHSSLSAIENHLYEALAQPEQPGQGSDAAKAAHMLDLYDKLGVRWGDDPFTIIAKMRQQYERAQLQLEPDKELCSFYGVTTYAQLVAEQEGKIERLQAQLQKLEETPVFHGKIREG